MFAGLRLRWRSRPSLVDQVLRDIPGGPVPPAVDGHVRVAAVQMRYRPVDEATGWIEQCHALTTAAARAGAQVVAFPALTPLALATALAGEPLAADLLALADTQGPALTSTWRRLYPASHRLYHRTFAFLARGFAVTIIAGALPAPSRRGRPRLIAHVFGPDGRVRLRQPAEAPGLLAGTERQTVNLGATLLAVALQSTLPAIAGLPDDTDLLALLPTASQDGAVLPGPAIAESLGRYVIRSYLVGQAGDGTLRGRSGIYAPPELAAEQNGVLAEVEQEEAEEVVVATLDLAALRDRRTAADQADNAPGAGVSPQVRAER